MVVSGARWQLRGAHRPAETVRERTGMGDSDRNPGATGATSHLQGGGCQDDGLGTPTMGKWSDR